MPAKEVRDPLSLKKLFQEFLVAAVVVTLLFASQIESLLDPKNSFFLIWQFSDALAVITTILVLSAILAGIPILAAVRRWKWLETVYGAVLIFLVVDGLFSLQHFVPRESRWGALVFLATMGLVGYQIGVPQFWGARVAKNLCLVFSPFVLMVFYQLLANPTWGPEREPKTAAKDSFKAAVPHAKPVFVLIFDQWSWQRSTDGDEFLPFFHNVKQLAEQSFVFRNGRAPSTETKYSLPQIVYQTDLPSRAKIDPVAWLPPDTNHLTAGKKSIFAMAKDAGYKTALVGFYFPYRRILDGQIDYCYSPSHHPKGESFGEKMLLFGVSDCQYLADPLSQGLDERLTPMVYSRNWYNLNRDFEAEVAWVVSNVPRNSLTLIHWPLPHRPFVFNADGTYYGHEGGDKRGPYDDNGFLREVEFMYKTLGRFIDDLKDANLYEDALLIITADHGHWKDHDLHRVPLLVKLPGQSSSHEILEPFCNNQLGEIIQKVVHGGVDEVEFLNHIHKTSMATAYRPK